MKVQALRITGEPKATPWVEIEAWQAQIFQPQALRAQGAERVFADHVIVERRVGTKKGKGARPQLVAKRQTLCPSSITSRVRMPPRRTE